MTLLKKMIPFSHYSRFFQSNRANVYWKFTPLTLSSSYTNSASNGKLSQQEQNRFSFKHYMLEKISTINQPLDASVPFTNPAKIHESMRYMLLLPGKHICPIVCIAACELVGGTESTAMLSDMCDGNDSCHVPLLHDLPCMDNDTLRRGKPSNHVVFDEHVTVLAAYSLLAHAFEHIVTIMKGVSPDKVVRVVDELARLIGPEGVVSGQVADLRGGGERDIGSDSCILKEEWTKGKAYF